jgi:hypothetical protein
MQFRVGGLEEGHMGVLAIRAGHIGAIKAWPGQARLARATMQYITLQDFNVHGANTTHGTESEVFRGVKREEKSAPHHEEP